MKNKLMRTEVRNKIVMKGKRRAYQRRRGRPQIGMRLERRNISMKNKRMRTEVRYKTVVSLSTVIFEKSKYVQEATWTKV